jgi:hypothetical protein
VSEKERAESREQRAESREREGANERMCEREIEEKK